MTERERQRGREGGRYERDNNYVYMHTRNQVSMRNQVKTGNLKHVYMHCNSSDPENLNVIPGPQVHGHLSKSSFFHAFWPFVHTNTVLGH